MKICISINITNKCYRSINPCQYPSQYICVLLPFTTYAKKNFNTRTITGFSRGKRQKTSNTKFSISQPPPWHHCVIQVRLMRIENKYFSYTSSYQVLCLSKSIFMLLLKCIFMYSLIYRVNFSYQISGYKYQLPHCIHLTVSSTLHMAHLGSWIVSWGPMNIHPYVPLRVPLECTNITNTKYEQTCLFIASSTLLIYIIVIKYKSSLNCILY